MSAKSLLVQPIAAEAANAFVEQHHYSRRVVRNSQIHFGVYMDNRLEGVIQFGPSMDKRKLSGIVSGTGWNGFMEINRIAFTDYLPRNSESRALAVCLRLIRSRYPFVKWIVTYADACQCGDGTIYRACGFLLTDIKKNYNVRETEGGARVLNGKWDYSNTVPLKGFQLRYIFFLDPSFRDRLTVPALPYSEIATRGAKMARGIAGEASGDAPEDHSGESGSSPTPPLQSAPRGQPPKAKTQPRLWDRVGAFFMGDA